MPKSLVTGLGSALLSSTYNKLQRVAIFEPDLPRPAAAQFDGPAPINVLILGTGGQDAVMVAQLSAKRGRATLMAIPFDTFLPVHGHGDAALNDTVSLGGLGLTVNTVENFIGTRIDHVVSVEFDTVKELTDILGGVTVENTTAFTAGDGQFKFPKGTLHLNGNEALVFVSERDGLGKGDAQQTRNQRAFFKGLLDKAKQEDLIKRPARLMELFNALKHHVTLNDELTFAVASEIATAARSVRGKNMSFFASPIAGHQKQPNGRSVTLPDWDKIEALRTAMREGKLALYADSLKQR